MVSLITDIVVGHHGTQQQQVPIAVHAKWTSWDVGDHCGASAAVGARHAHQHSTRGGEFNYGPKNAISKRGREGAMRMQVDQARKRA